MPYPHAQAHLSELHPSFLVTENACLGKKVRFFQPENGYRVSIDPILVAAAVPALSTERILDVGSGVGVISFCLAHRIPGCTVHGLEICPEDVMLAEQNVALNQVTSQVKFFQGDLLNPPLDILPETYDHVVANPPYYEVGQGTLSKTTHKTLSTIEFCARLSDWADFSIRMVRPRGCVTFILTPDRITEFLSYVHGKLGDIKLYPLWSTRRKNMDHPRAKRIIIQGRKGTRGPTQILGGLQLHSKDGRFTSRVRKILDLAGGINLTS